MNGITHLNSVVATMKMCNVYIDSVINATLIKSKLCQYSHRDVRFMADSEILRILIICLFGLGHIEYALDDTILNQIPCRFIRMHHPFGRPNHNSKGSFRFINGQEFLFSLCAESLKSGFRKQVINNQCY